LPHPPAGAATRQRDAALMPQIERAWQANLQVYGTTKVCQQLNRAGIAVARCAVERLMRPGWTCRVRGVQDGSHDRARPIGALPVGSGQPAVPGRAAKPALGLGLHHRSTWPGWLYVAFVIDVFARCIVGWRVSTRMTTDFVLDALEQALHARQPADSDALPADWPMFIQPARRAGGYQVPAAAPRWQVPARG
jgi:transposase InsO family protein